MSAAGVTITGAVVSSMVKVANVFTLLPHSSVAVKVTVALPVIPQPSLNVVKLLLQTTPLQVSLADAPPFEASHAASSAPLPKPSHSTVISCAGMVTTGLVVSSIVKVAGVSVLLLPHSSVAVKVTVALPVIPQPSLNVVKLLVHTMEPQVSLAIAPPAVANQAFNWTLLPKPSHSTVRFWAGVISTGLVVSSIVKVAVVVLALPHESVAVKVTVAEPVSPQSSLNPL